MWGLDFDYTNPYLGRAGNDPLRDLPVDEIHQGGKLWLGKAALGGLAELYRFPISCPLKCLKKSDARTPLLA